MTYRLLVLQKMLLLLSDVHIYSGAFIISGNKPTMALSQKPGDARLPTSLSLCLCWVVDQCVQGLRKALLLYYIPLNALSDLSHS